MQTPMTAKVAQIIHETETMTLPEKQNLFWVMLEKFGQENIFSYQTIYTSTGRMVVLPEYLKTSLPKSKNYLNIMQNWKGTLSSDFEMNEDEFYQ